MRDFNKKLRNKRWFIAILLVLIMVFGAMLPVTVSAFTAEANFTGYFQLLDKHGQPLSNASWELCEGFYEEGFNGVDPVDITFGGVLESGESDVNGYIEIDNSSQISSEDFQYACMYFLVKFPEDTSELSAKGRREDSGDIRHFDNPKYLTYQMDNFSPYQLNGYTLVGRSATVATTGQEVTTIYGESPDTPFVIGVVGEFTIVEKYENKDTGGSLQVDQITTKLTAENFTSALPPSTITSKDIAYSLQGYYLDDEKVMRTDYPVTINGVFDNHTIRHQYTGQYTLSFNAKGGSPVPPSQTLGFKEKTVEPAPPAKLGFDFLGWYEADDTEWNFDSRLMPAKNVALHAKWKRTAYKVTFDSNKGSKVQSQTVPHGEKVNEPADPTKTNYIFGGWYTDNNTFESAWNFDTNTVTEDLTLYGKWLEGSGGTESTDTQKPLAPTKSTQSKESTATQTGDNSSTILWISGICILLAVIVMAWVACTRKRREKR